MRKNKTPLFILALCLPIWLNAQDLKPIKQKTIQALRAEEVIQINGILEENIWQEPGSSDFIQSDPIDGAEPSEKTEVWIAFDNKALYIGARLYDSEPGAILSRLGRRDDFVDSDWFIFAVDPYYDRRTGFQFAVNPAGSIVDWTLFNDGFNDETWDGVWEWASHIDAQGWCVEMRIPFHQLRFSPRDKYEWGVNFRRIIKRKNERVGYVWIPKEDNGYVSHFAKLVGITDIKPGRHIEFLPYTVSQARLRPAEEGNPFETGKRFLGNFGFDTKIGLKSNLTLDATVNPDFGQVEVDPAVINLSDFETFYQEKRPFFVEGSNIFDTFGSGGVLVNANINWSNPRFFYSRRIGRAPQGYVDQPGYVRYPGRTTILGAFKLTGKIAGGWNFNAISSLAAREYAEINNHGEQSFTEVEPFSNYSALRAQKEYNEGRQGLGFLVTSVIRDLRKENLSDILNQRAFSLGMDGWSFLDKDKAWVANLWLGGTLVEGSQERIRNLQQSSLHYYQRPDASHVSIDENATSLKGWGGRFQLGRQKGNWLFHFVVGALSPGFDPNDMGFQFGMSDHINTHLLVGYQQPQPGKILRSWVLYGGPFRNYDFGGNKTWDGILISWEGQMLNYWGFNTMFAYNPQTIDNTLTRGGPLAVIPSGWQYDINLYSDNRKPIVFSTYGSVYHRPTEGFRGDTGMSLRWKPSSNFDFSVGPSYSLRRSRIQWVTRVDDALMTATFGKRYIFGRIEQQLLSSEIRLNWTFTPKLSLQLYLQPFLAVGAYDQFRELARPKSYEYNIYGENHSKSFITYTDNEYTVDPDGPGPAAAFSFHNPDFNYKSLRGTIVLRWEYLPGSTLYFVWTQNRADYSHPGELRLRRDLGDLLTAPGDNIFVFKITYRWNL